MKPTVQLLAVTWPVNPEDTGLAEPEDLIEFAGRWDYGEKSVAKLRSDPTIIARWLASGEESMVEMVDAVFLVTCSRVVSHELVRHRIASYQQESQRFVKYEGADPDDLFYVPPEVEAAGEDAIRLYNKLMDHSLRTYENLKSLGVKSQVARYVLPNATRTRIIVKMNLREWRHVLRLRMHTSAQPEMRLVARAIHKILQEELGAVLIPDDLADERAVR